MSNKKKTMYEILEISPIASLEEIKAAHKRLSLEVMRDNAGSHDLNREECEFRLNILDVALNTLSAPVSRTAYDSELAASISLSSAVVPYKLKAPLPEEEAKVHQAAIEVINNYKTDLTNTVSQPSPWKIFSQTTSASAKSLKKVLRVVTGILILGSVLTIGKISFASRTPALSPSEIAKAEERLIILEYYKKYGVRPASRAEAEFLEAENRRKEYETRTAEFERKKLESEYQRFADESRQIGERVHSNLMHNEAVMLQRQLQQEEQKRQQIEEIRQQAESEKEAEQARIENERRKLGLDNQPISTTSSY